MGRNRSDDNSWMPQFTKFDGKHFVYYRQSTGEYKRLALKDAPRWEQLKAYDQFIEGGNSTFKDCIYAYLDSSQFKSLRKATQDKYRTAIATQSNQEIMFSFGEMEPQEIQAPDIRLFMDSWAHQPGKANTMHTALSAIFQWCLERGYILGANPCRAVKKYPEKRGGRYVDDLEYKAFFNFLIDNDKTAHACAMAIAYLCGARQQDVLRLTKHRPFNVKDTDCYATASGLMIYQEKTGKVQLKTWSQELKSVFDLACRVDSSYVISNSRGQRYTRGGFNSTWQRMQRKALEEGVIENRFRFHDMKIKASSDVNPEKRALFLGATESTANRYNRTADAVEPVR